MRCGKAPSNRNPRPPENARGRSRPGLGKALAEKNPDVTVGFPCSVGGTPLSRWQKGGDLYSNAVARAKLAMQSGTLRASSGIKARATARESRRKLRRAPRPDDSGFARRPRHRDLPFVAGELGQFLLTRGSNNVAEVKIVNAALAELPARVPHTGFVPSTGLNHKGDALHFDAPSQREFGRRYAAEMLKLQSPP